MHKLPLAVVHWQRGGGFDMGSDMCGCVRPMAVPVDTDWVR